MYEIVQSNQFKKDWRKLKNQPKKIEKALKIIESLSISGVKGLAEKNKPHPLKGGFIGFLECHIMPDLLLIWEQRDDLREIHLARIGSHSELF